MGVRPFEMLSTTSVKLRMSWSVVSQAATVGCDESLATSSRTIASVWSIGGRSIVSPASGSGRAGAAGATSLLGRGPDVGRRGGGRRQTRK